MSHTDDKAAILNAIEALLDVDDEHTGWERIVALQERAEKAEARLAAVEQAVRDRFGPQAELILPTQETDQ